MIAICLLLAAVVGSGVEEAELDAAGRHSLKTLGGFVALSVPNAEATAQWYEQKLGMRVTSRPAAGPDFRVVVLEGRGWMIELLQRSDGRPLSAVAPQITSRDQIHGIFKVGVLVENFDRTLAFLQSRGVPIAFGPYPAQGNQKANVIIRDLDGNLIQFIAR